MKIKLHELFERFHNWVGLVIFIVGFALIYWGMVYVILAEVFAGVLSVVYGMMNVISNAGTIAEALKKTKGKLGV